jgi:hypothetical protein
LLEIISYLGLKIVSYKDESVNKNTKKSIAFFLVVLCGVGFLNCKGRQQPQALDEQREQEENMEHYK